MESAPVSTNGNANRQIARAAGIVMAAFAFGQVIGLVAKVLTANAFGTGMEADAFYTANSLPDLIFQIMAGGALASAFVPTFTGLLAREDHEGAWKLASSIVNLLLLLMIGVALLAELFAPQVVRYLLAPGAVDDPGKFALTVALLRIMLPSAVIFGLSGLAMGVLNSHQHFLFPALAPSMYQIGWILGVLVLAPYLGVYGLAWGIVIGAGFHLLVQVPSLLRLKGRYYPILGLHLGPVREVGRLMAPRLFGVAAVQLNFLLNTILSSFFPEGSLAGIKYAMPIMLVPEVIIAQAIAIAAMPTFSAQVALGKVDEMRSSLVSALRAVLLLSLPASLGLILLRRPLVALIYQHGTFDAASTDLVAWALLWYAVGLVGHSVIEVVYRAFYSLHDTKTPVILVTISMGLNLVFSLVFTRLFGLVGWAPHGGLALANSVATLLEMGGSLVFIRRKVGGLQLRRLAEGLAKSALATAIMSALLLAWSAWSAGRAYWMVAILGIAIGGGAYLLAMVALRVPEVRLLFGALSRRARSALQRA